MLKVTVSLLPTAPNVQALPDGNPEHAKPVTLVPLRLPEVSMVMVVEPLCPGADTVTVVGLAVSVKLWTSRVCAIDVDGRKSASPG
jgi:hypothetical protein